MRIHRLLVSCLALAMLPICAARPKQEIAAHEAPHSVVIQAFPQMKLWALIGNSVGAAFTDKNDYLFEAPSVETEQRLIAAANSMHVTAVAVNRNGSPVPSIGSAAAVGLVGGLVAGIIEAGAEKTQKLSMGFDTQARAYYPTLDLRGDLLAALQAELQARGVQASVEEQGLAELPPRLRWPAQDEEGQPLPSLEADSSPPVDADLLVQLSPVAIYRSPGPLNAYRRMAMIRLAVYEGRSKRFLGRQLFSFHGSGFEYYKYDSLLMDLPAAIPALREALLSLVPQLADAIGAPPATEPYRRQLAPLVMAQGPVQARARAVAAPAPLAAASAAAEADAGATPPGSAPLLPVTVPFLGPRGQAQFIKFQQAPLPRAFAISRNGYFASVYGFKPKDPSKPRDPSARALVNCRESSGQECVLYMVDHALVYRDAEAPR